MEIAHSQIDIDSFFITGISNDYSKEFAPAGNLVFLPASAVLDMKAASECIRQFLADQARPTCIQWVEL